MQVKPAIMAIIVLCFMILSGCSSPEVATPTILSATPNDTLLSPTPITPAATATLTPSQPTLPPAEMTLVDAYQQKKIVVEVTGAGLMTFHLKIQRLVNQELVITIPVGTTFVATRRDIVYDSVVTREKEIILNDETYQYPSVEVACADLGKESPKLNDRLEPRPPSDHPELTRVLESLPPGLDFDVLQAVIWIITDDADFWDMGQLRLIGTLKNESAIEADEAIQAMQLVDQAGIDITQKAVWLRHSDQIQSMFIKDKRLEDWLLQVEERLPQPVRTIPINQHITAMKISPDGKVLAVGTQEGVIQLWSMENSNKLRELSAFSWRVEKLTFAQNGNVLAGISDNLVKVWETNNYNLLLSRDDAWDMALSPDGKTLAMIGAGKLNLVDITSRQVIDQVGSATSSVFLEFLPDGQTLVYCSFEGALKTWDTSTHQAHTVLNPTWMLDNNRVEIALSPLESLMAYWEIKDGFFVIQMMDLQTSQVVSTLPAYNGYPKIYFAPNGNRLAAAVYNVVKIWDVETQQLIQILQIKGLELLDGQLIALNPDGSMLAAYTDKEISFWEINP